MGRYVAGPSRLVMGGQSIEPGQAFEYDFSVDGPEGEHGPARETTLIACGAIVPESVDAPPASADVIPANDTTTRPARTRRSKE